MLQILNSHIEILVIDSETPDNRMEIISLFEDSDAILEEFSVSKFPKNETKIENVLVENILRFKVSIHLNFTAWT